VTFQTNDKWITYHHSRIIFKINISTLTVNSPSLAVPLKKAWKTLNIPKSYTPRSSLWWTNAVINGQMSRQISEQLRLILRFNPDTRNYSGCFLSNTVFSCCINFSSLLTKAFRLLSVTCSSHKVHLQRSALRLYFI